MPVWDIKKIYRLEEEWLDKIEKHRKDGKNLLTVGIDSEEQFELAWLGFLQMVDKTEQESLLNASTIKGDRESVLGFLSSYGNNEYSQLVSLVMKGRALHILHINTFRTIKDTDLREALDELKPPVVNKIMRGTEKGLSFSTRAAYQLAVVGFYTLSADEQRNIVHEKVAKYPSAEWWDLMQQLVYRGLEYVAIIAKKWNDEQNVARQALKDAAQKAKRDEKEVARNAKKEAAEKVKKAMAEAIQNARKAIKEKDDAARKEVEAIEKAKQEKQEQEKKAMQKMVDEKRVAVNRVSVPSPVKKASDFQQFLKNMLFGHDKGIGVPYPVYPFYIRLPEGYIHPNNSKMWDVEQMLQQNASTDMMIDGCKSSMPYLQPHQAVVNAMLQLRANGSIGTPGLLAMHSTGAGKTLLTLCALLAFWNLDKVPVSDESDTKVPKPTPSNDTVITSPIPIFIVSVKSNQNDNGVDKLAQYAMTFFQDFEDLTVAKDDDDRFPFDVRKNPKYEKEISYIKHHRAAKGKTPIEKMVVIPSQEATCIEIAAKAIKKRLKRGFATAAVGQVPSDRDLYTFETIGNDLNLLREEEVKGGSNRGEKKNKKKKIPVYPERISNALFVVDEAHYMNLPYNKGSNLKKSYDTLRDALQERRDPKTTWCLAMTATPGETKQELMALLRAVGTSSTFKNKRGKIVEGDAAFGMINGLISYAQLYGDFSHFARIEPYLHCYDIPKTDYYNNLYQRALCKIGKYKSLLPQDDVTCGKIKANKSYEDEAKSYKYLRSVSNFIRVIQGNPNEEKVGGGNYGLRKGPKVNYNYNDDAKDATDEDDDEALEGDGNDEDTIDNRYKFVTSEASDKRKHISYNVYASPKLRAVLDNILAAPNGKHYVYSADKQTIGVLAALLTNAGYRALLPFRQDPHTKEYTFKESQTGQPHFIMLDNLTYKKTHIEPLTYMNGNDFASGNTLTAQIEACKRRANASSNADGHDVRVILATADHFKGVDLNHLKYLHLVDAMADYQDFIQFVGRGSRYCSHKLWRSMAARKVKIFLYHQTGPVEDWYPDKKMWQNSLTIYREQWGDVEEMLQKASVDYLVFKDTIHANTHAIQASLQNVECSAPTFEPLKKARVQADMNTAEAQKQAEKEAKRAAAKAQKKAEKEARKEQDKAKREAEKAAAKAQKKAEREAEKQKRKAEIKAEIEAAKAQIKAQYIKM